MARLDAAQIAALVRVAGANPGQALYATAIALAESGGDTSAKGPNTRYGNASGLFQIMPPGPNGENFDQLQSPITNVNAAKARSKGWTDWQQWEAYTGPDGKGVDGRWKAFIRQAEAGVNKAYDEQLHAGLVDSIGDFVSDPTGIVSEAIEDTPLAAIGNLASALGNPEWWKRIGVGAAGVAFIVFAGVWILKDLAAPAAAKLPGPVGVAGKVGTAMKAAK